MSMISRLRSLAFSPNACKAIAGGETGEIRFGLWDWTQSPPEGWLWLAGGTIAKSGVTATYAADIYQELFEHLWNLISDTYCPVSSGRGVSSLEDWKAGKTLTLLDSRGKGPICQAASGTASALGKTGGLIDMSVSLPAHYHGMGTGADLSVDLDHDHASFTTASGGEHTHAVSDPAHAHDQYVSALASGSGKRRDYNDDSPSTAFPQGIQTGAALTGISVTSTNSGHTHSINVPALGATSEAPTGRIGLVTGGVDGNAAMTSGTANPPFFVGVAKIAI